MTVGETDWVWKWFGRIGEIKEQGPFNFSVGRASLMNSNFLMDYTRFWFCASICEKIEIF